MVRILITSGHAQTGSGVIEALAKAGHHVVAGLRDPSKGDDLLKKGAKEVVHFDFDNVDSIKKAVKGVERILITHGGTPHTVTYTQRVVDAAKEAGTVKFIARVSSINADATSANYLRKAHGAADKSLENSGISWAVIGPSWFDENWLHQKEAFKTGKIYGAAGSGKTVWVALADINAVTAGLLAHPEKYAGKLHRITGPEAITDADCVRLIGEAIKKPVEYVNLSPEEFAKSLKSHGFSEDAANLYTTLESMKAESMSSTVSGDVQAVTGHPPTSFRDWAAQHAAAFL